MKNFAKAAKSMLIFCFTFMMIGCIWSVHQAEAKTKTIQKGVTYDTDLEEVFMDISKLTPEEGKRHWTGYRPENTATSCWLQS
ncbi:hypothetical protein C823_000269 [Eubacterium plexicaudatum ASF492]|nr:hypothetical protein C823_000269 [Eubacterium plexicaudatum ASF492]